MANGLTLFHMTATRRRLRERLVTPSANVRVFFLLISYGNQKGCTGIRENAYHGYGFEYAWRDRTFSQTVGNTPRTCRVFFFLLAIKTLEDILEKLTTCMGSGMLDEIEISRKLYEAHFALVGFFFLVNYKNSGGYTWETYHLYG